MFVLQQELSTKVWWNIEKKFFNTSRFSSYNTNKFILLLGKGVYPYECMVDWKKLNKILLPEKYDF